MLARFRKKPKFDVREDKNIWNQFIDEVEHGYNEFSDEVSTLDESKMLQILSSVMVSIGRNGFLTQERKQELFRRAEQMGIHIMPTHFYSPVPNTTELLDRDFQKYDEIGLDLNSEEQFQFLESLQEYFNELSDIPHEQTDSEFEYYYNNPAFCGIDASVYYALIRHFKPKRVLEVGAGYSTMIAAKAARKNETTHLTIIEPYPFDILKRGFSGLQHLIEQKVQDVDMSVFEELEANDILFIDNSHVSKIGSDVNHVILRILPRLKKGVIIHFHDIFIPYEYPKQWVAGKHIFWNEQYILQSFLLFNSNFKTLLGSYYLARTDEDRLRKIANHSPHFQGGSYWIQRI